MSILSGIRQDMERREMRANSQIRLINHGIVDAIPANEVQVGMRLMLNYGATYDIVGKASASKQFTVFKLVSLSGSDKGKEYDHKRRNDSLMAAWYVEN